MANNLESILDESYAAVVRGDYASLALLAPEVELAALAATRAELIALLPKAERNSACMAAASRGIKAVLRRLSDLRDVSNGLTTYDESGQRSQKSCTQKFSHRF